MASRANKTTDVGGGRGAEKDCRRSEIPSQKSTEGQWIFFFLLLLRKTKINSRGGKENGFLEFLC